MVINKEQAEFNTIKLGDGVEVKPGDTVFFLSPKSAGSISILAGKLLWPGIDYLEERQSKDGPLEGVRSIPVCMLEYRDDLAAVAPVKETKLHGVMTKVISVVARSSFSTLDAATCAMETVAEYRRAARQAASENEAKAIRTFHIERERPAGRLDA